MHQEIVRSCENRPLPNQTIQRVSRGGSWKTGIQVSSFLARRTCSKPDFAGIWKSNCRSHQNCGASVFNFYLPKLNEESVQGSWLEVHADGRTLCSLLASVVFLNLYSKRRMASPIFAVET